VYVYRDPELAAEAKDRDERDAAYWYGLSQEEAAPAAMETRGPFEPLVPSSGQVPPGTGPPADQAGAAEPEAGHGGGPGDTGESRARKLDQIRDFYLTAEAIGEENVGKHFDQLLAQQRDLISQYFKKPGPANPGAARPDAEDPGDGAARGQADPAKPGAGGEQAGGSSPAQGAGVAAEQPRTW
jgi:hypothetical protein